MKKEQIIEMLKGAIAEDNLEKFVEMVATVSDQQRSEIENQFEELASQLDRKALANRGYKEYTAEEKAFYNQLMEAGSARGISNAVSGMELTLPPTIINNVFEELEQKFPLLGLVDLVNVGASTKWVFRTSPQATAMWGNLGDAITQEQVEDFKAVDLTSGKLTAFMSVPNYISAMGIDWVDKYVRTRLGVAIAKGLESAIVSGNGKNCPIGMASDIHDGVSVSAGAYPLKTATKIKNFGKEEMGKVVANLARTEAGDDRQVDEVLLICNPQDYYTKIMPATTTQGLDGNYIANVFPIKTRVIQSSAVQAGKAILGLADHYQLAVSLGDTGGRLEKSSEFKFLDDVTTYKIKMYAHGRAFDNTCFAYLDISTVAPVLPVVATKTQS